MAVARQPGRAKYRSSQPKTQASRFSILLRSPEFRRRVHPLRTTTRAVIALTVEPWRCKVCDNPEMYLDWTAGRVVCASCSAIQRWVSWEWDEAEMTEDRLFARLQWLLGEREKEKTPERKAIYWNAINEIMRKLFRAMGQV